VPPEFRPSERSKKKQEPLEPKQPRTVKDIVDDIMRDYRDRQRELGNVDNWGQPKEKLDKRKVEKWVRDNLPKLGGDEGQTSKRGKKRFMPSAPEGLSEAIGSKLKGKDGDSKEDKKRPKLPKAPKMSRPKQPNPSSREKRRTSPKLPTKKPDISSPKKPQETKYPWNKVRPSDSDKGLKDTDNLAKEIAKGLARKHDVKPTKNVSDKRIGKLHKMKLYTPEIRGKKITSESQLRKILKDELSGMKHLPNFDKIMNDAVAHMKLKEMIGDMSELKLSEIKSLSKQVGLPLRTSRHYVYERGKPQFYRLAEKAITKSEAKLIIDRLRSTLRDIKNHRDVESKLKEKGVFEHLQKLPSYEQNDGMVHKYYKYIDTLREGGLMSNLARRVGVSEGTCIQWNKGILPLYVKEAVATSDVAKSNPSVSEKIKPSDSTIDRLLESRINMKPGEIQGIPIITEKQLRTVITTEYPGINDMPGFDKLLHEACVHIRVMNQLQGRDRLEYGEIRELAREFDVKRGTFSIWTTKNVIPRLYYQINRSISRSEALEKLNWIREKNNGVITQAEYDRRFSNYYLINQEQSASFQKRESEFAQKYLEFFDVYQLGGPLNHIARKAGVAPSTGLGWLEGTQPRNIRIASAIPEQRPKEGHLWLPLKFQDGRYPENFIQVPIKVENYREVIAVLKQLQPIENEYLNEIQKRFGRRPIEEEFMYLLGAYMSDGSSFNKTTLARSVGIRLARTYPWSKDFGDGMCQSLGACGIYAHQVQNTQPKTTFIKTGQGMKEIYQNEKLNWASENSPLLHWIHHSCLGFNDATPKTKQPVNANWIFGSTIEMRRAIVQGLGDGDGSASVEGKYICISSKSNKNFIERLLQSFDLKTRRTEGDVFTAGITEAKKAAQIPPFRYATSRLDAAERILKS